MSAPGMSVLGMSVLGMDAARVRELLSPVDCAESAPGGTDGDRFARAAWSGLAEPGDGIAGLVCAALGAEAALTAVIERWAPARLAETLALAGRIADPADLAAAQQRWTPRLSSSAVVQSLHLAARMRARLLVPGDPMWPGGLEDLGDHAPLALWWRGNRDAFEGFGRAVALVGARAATAYGEQVTMEASAGLVDRDFAIVSGAAYGIDGMAHRAALASRGTTMAFLAGGVDRFYPSGHDALLTRIVQTGLVLSELPCGAAPTRWRFLQRNRLIAASSLATIVLEAGARSGSINTAGQPMGLSKGYRVSEQALPNRERRLAMDDGPSDPPVSRPAGRETAS